MADINLTQADADALLSMEKQKVDDSVHEYPSLGGAIRVHLQSPDKRELFFLDITRSQIKLAKGTYQNRARGVVILARLDFGGAPTATRTTKRWRALTYTFIARATATGGRCRFHRVGSRMLAILGCSC